jgi:hypothetical protein
MDSAEKRVAELEAEVERLRSAPWPGQGNVVLEAYRAANVDPHCEVPHEDMAELIDRAVRENDRLRAAMDTADRALAYCDEPPRLVAAARSQIRAALRRPEEEQPGAPRQGAKTPDDPEGRSPLVPQVGGRPAGRAPSAASAPPNLAALTGPWKIERDEIGLAVALSRGGVWVVHLREGSFRNNSEGGAEVVCAELNRAASAPREYAETLEYLEWIAENHERQSGQFASGVHWLATELIERLRTAPLASPAGGEARPTCVWSHDDEDGDLWEGTCGVAWSLPNGTPKENGMGWCPKCGEELVEYRAEDFDDAPDQLKEPAPPPATGDVFEFIRMANEMNDLCELEAPWLDSATEYLRSRFGGCVAALENLHRTTRYLATAGGTGIGTRDALKEAERVLSELRAAGAKKKE